MNNSIILQVDESTKGLMEELQSGISSSIEEGIREVKSSVESVDGNTDMILRKFRNFDGLNNSIDQLRSLAEESKKFTAIVSPLQSSMLEIHHDSKANEQILSEQKKNIDLLIKGLVEIGEKQNSLFSDLKNEVDEIMPQLTNGDEQIAKKISEGVALLERNQASFTNNVNTSLSQIATEIEHVQNDITSNSDKIKEGIHLLSDAQKDFESKYFANESSHKEFESNTSLQLQSINESIEKIQATLDIIVNLVTPFWKKW